VKGRRIRPEDRAEQAYPFLVSVYADPTNPYTTISGYVRLMRRFSRTGRRRSVLAPAEGTEQTCTNVMQDGLYSPLSAQPGLTPIACGDVTAHPNPAGLRTHYRTVDEDLGAPVYPPKALP
jgi:hypothetical protein